MLFTPIAGGRLSPLALLSHLSAQLMPMYYTLIWESCTEMVASYPLPTLSLWWFLVCRRPWQPWRFPSGRVYCSCWLIAECDYTADLFMSFQGSSYRIGGPSISRLSSPSIPHAFTNRHNSRVSNILASQMTVYIEIEHVPITSLNIPQNCCSWKSNQETRHENNHH